MSTASSKIMPALPTSDLRSESKTYLRDKNHSAKWSRGGRSAPGKQCGHSNALWGPSACNECIARPCLPDDMSTKQFWSKLEKHDIHTRGRRKLANNLKVVTDDFVGTHLSSDTGSSDDEVAVVSAAPVPESEIMYSYDAQTGPSAGGDVLSHAVMQAVQRFENKQTEQLIKNEYDLVLDGKELEDAYAGDAEDEYELIGHEDWN